MENRVYGVVVKNFTPDYDIDKIYGELNKEGIVPHVRYELAGGVFYYK